MRDGWREAALGEVYDLVSTRLNPASLPSDTTYVGLEHIDPGNLVPTINATVLGITSSVTPFEPNDVLFGRLRPYLRKVALASQHGVCSPEILVLRTRPTVGLPSFLALLSSTNKVLRRCIEMSAGSRMPRTSANDLASIQM